MNQTPTAGYRTHIGLGEIADISATHAAKNRRYSPVRGVIVTCECGSEFGGYSEHAFHLATEAVAYANGRRLDPAAEFDRKFGEED